MTDRPRLPATTRLGAVRLQVADLERSLRWYREVLGARLLHREGAVAQLGASASDQPLLELHERPGATPMPSRGRLGLFHVAWLLPDRASLGRFLTHLTARQEHVGSADHLVSEALYLHDPDGLGVEVYRDRPRDEWTFHGTSVQMASLPIDGQGLLREGRLGRFEGLPEGSCIGHVHLHVGDLDESTRFYRDVIGLDVTNASYPGAVFLAAGGYHHHLGTNTWAGSSAAPPRADDARLLDWTIVVPQAADVDAVAARAEQDGAVFERPSPGVLRVTDPWGTAVLVQTA
jgi:catechol 2,3-dioxygenase